MWIGAWPTFFHLGQGFGQKHLRPEEEESGQPKYYEIKTYQRRNSHLSTESKDSTALKRHNLGFHPRLESHYTSWDLAVAANGPT